MSGRRARRERKEQEIPSRARGVILTAERMLAIDFSHIQASHTRQAIVGWMRHAYEQSRVIAQLNLAGLGHAAAPNRRSFFETLIRLMWLDGVDQPDRAGTVDAMLAEDKKNANKEVNALSKMGVESDADLEDMDSIILDVTKVDALREQARVFLHAAQASQFSAAGLYKAWRQETQYSHTTAVLGGAYAPNDEGQIGTGRPPEADPDLEMHILAMTLVVTIATTLLKEEGVSMGEELFVAFFD